ncbi:histidine phosphatase family protein [Piscinibacter sakaiensis]|uniref:Phosphoglycerate mutase family n=1 Tax=Piscinibacter sakaiensis TaxID=1547922 RepID=A0A0K8P4J9_PISS1|nr:histidine phosphatase family protein [Piscinibacter sakaiensis]GAP37582.1 phosphoglycerate mutase family [Piscinibacter sakaiensis]
MSLQATRVLAIRHGETAWNVDTRIQGQLDIGLNPTGRRQAERLARALAQEPLAAVYSSDLSRAVDTARPVAAAAGRPLRLDAGLRERAFGRFEGRTFDEIAQAWPDDSLRWRRRDPSFGPAGGETLSAFYDRCVATAERLAAAHPGEAIALVAHGGVLDCLYRAATRLDLQAPRTWLVANAGINRLLYTGEGFTLVGWADLGHLQDLSLDEFADGGAAADRAGPAA